MKHSFSFWFSSLSFVILVLTMLALRDSVAVSLYFNETPCITHHDYVFVMCLMAWLCLASVVIMTTELMKGGK